MSSNQPLALTMGDPAGIGLDLTISCWLKRRELSLPPFIYLGDIDALRQRAALIGHKISVVETAPDQAVRLFENHIPAVSLSVAQKVVAGQPRSENANAIIGSIKLATELCNSGQASAIVTNPIAKSVLYDAGFSHPGHTEFLAELARSDNEHAPLPIMMLAGQKLRTVPVTIHIPVMHIMEHLTTDLIVRTAQVVARDLKKRFGIKEPRLAVSGLNPHAGEGGALGQEDDAIILPAVKKLGAEGLDVVGPLPADTMFHDDARANYDVAICMYHDQALIPAKALGFHDSVNVTLGLPFIRTSPDHGTAFDIAGKNIARHDSLVEAIKMASHMADQQNKLTGFS